MIKRVLCIILAFCLLLLCSCAAVPEAISERGEPSFSFDIEDCSFISSDGAEIELINDNPIPDYRSHYGLGTCHTLEGEQTVLLFFIDDGESLWTKEDITQFTELRILPALDFLQNEAQSWGKELTFKIKRFSNPTSDGLDMTYDGTVIKDLNIAGSTKDIPEQLAVAFGFADELKLLAAFAEEFETENIIPLVFVNKDGTAYARHQLSEQIVDHLEHAVIFSEPLGVTANTWRFSGRRTATIAHEILHLFGAEDYYLTDNRLRLAEKHFKDDIMLLDTFTISRLHIRECTAYHIGWTDELPEVWKDEKWKE